jgi:G protein-coupled receptor Mth (Methuselah protein)
MKVGMHLLKIEASKMCSRRLLVVAFIVFSSLCFGVSGKPKVTINKCCRIGDRLTPEKQCSAAAGSDKWVPKVYLPAKGSYYNKTGQLPPFMKAEEEVFPACKQPQYFATSNNIILMANGSLFLGQKHVMVDPENYCLEKDSALVCFDDHLGDPESLIEASIKMRKCCGPKQAYKDGLPCSNLDKSHSLYNSKIIETHRIDWSFSFPDCPTNDFAVAGLFEQENFKPETGELKTQSGKILEPDQYCLDYVLGENKIVNIFTCSEHFSTIPIAAEPKDIKFTIYATSLLISVFFLAATLAVGFLLLSNHHVLHWKCQTNYVLCLLIGDFLLAVTQIAGSALTGVLCYGIGEWLFIYLFIF